MDSDKWYKINPTDTMWWYDNADEEKGARLFSFDRKKVFNLFLDYDKLTPEQRAVFNRENPILAALF